MSRHNHTLFMSIQCNMSLLSRCIVGHPTSVNLTSLSRGNQLNFIALLKERTTVCIPAFDHSVFHHDDYISAKKKKYVSLPCALLYHLLGDFLCDDDLFWQLGEFLAPTLLKITNCLVLSLLV